MHRMIFYICMCMEFSIAYNLFKEIQFLQMKLSGKLTPLHRGAKIRMSLSYETCNQEL